MPSHFFSISYSHADNSEPLVYASVCKLLGSNINGRVRGGFFLYGNNYVILASIRNSINAFQFQAPLASPPRHKIGQSKIIKV